MEHIFETEICCWKETATEDELERLGLKPETPEEQWMKITIDLRQCVAVRENSDHDGGPQVTLYINSDAFTVRGEYDDIRARWIKARDADYFKAL